MLSTVHVTYAHKGQGQRSGRPSARGAIEHLLAQCARQALQPAKSGNVTSRPPPPLAVCFAAFSPAPSLCQSAIAHALGLDPTARFATCSVRAVNRITVTITTTLDGRSGKQTKHTNCTKLHRTDIYRHQKSRTLGFLCGAHGPTTSRRRALIL